MEQINRNSIFFDLHYEDKTAYISGNSNANGDVFIPRSIQHKSHTFIIKGIKENSFNHNTHIKSVIFANDSEVTYIEKKCFCIFNN